MRLDSFRLLKDLSADQLVMGRMHRILVNILIFGYIEVTCLRVAAGVDGTPVADPGVVRWVRTNPPLA